MESLQLGGGPGGVLGEQQAAGAGLLLEVVKEEIFEGVALLLMTKEQGICAGIGGADLSG